MKFRVEAECTPEEARRLMGLPDLTEVHEIYLSRMRTAVDQGITPDLIETMMRSWAPMGEAGFSMWRRFVEQMGRAAPE